jgi:hypothetical protein
MNSQRYIRMPQCPANHIPMPEHVPAVKKKRNLPSLIGGADLSRRISNHSEVE